MTEERIKPFLVQVWSRVFPGVPIPNDWSVRHLPARKQSEHAFVTLEIADVQKGPIAYLKLTPIPAAKISVFTLFREYKCLRFLSSRLSHIPKPLGFFQLNGGFALSMTALPGTAAETVLHTPELPRLLTSVYRFYSSRQTSCVLPKNQFLARWNRVLAVFQAEFSADFEAMTPRFLEAKSVLLDSELPVFYQHNDFNVWNMRWDGEAIQVFDFEDCRLKGLMLMDLFYFYVIGIYWTAGQVADFKSETEFLSQMAIFKSSWKAQTTGLSVSLIQSLFLFFCLERIAVDLAPKRHNTAEATRWMHLLRADMQSDPIETLVDLFAHQYLHRFYKSTMRKEDARNALENYHKITDYWFEFL